MNNEINFRLSLSTEYGIRKSQPALHGQREQECFWYVNQQQQFENIIERYKMDK